MKHIILARAFGDFMVALSTLATSKHISTYKIYASAHHYPLYEAIPDQYKNKALDIEFVDWGIKKSMLGIFTNQQLLHPNTWIELKKLRNWLHQQPPNNHWVVEQDLRKNALQLFTGINMNHIASGENIYEQYQTFFESTPRNIDPAPDQMNNILILPSARLSFRNIPPSIVDQIKHKHQQLNHRVTIAFFEKQIPPIHESSDCQLYTDFKQLIQLIITADYIYTPDSLSAHLAYFFGKPHSILHPAQVSPAFFTPFALANRTHFSFAEFTRS